VIAAGVTRTLLAAVRLRAHKLQTTGSQPLSATLTACQQVTVTLQLAGAWVARFLTSKGCEQR